MMVVMMMMMMMMSLNILPSHSSSFKIIENGIIRKLWYGFLLTLHIKYGRITNVTDTQLATARRHRPRLCIASRGKT